MFFSQACAQLPLLTVCRLPFDIRTETVDELREGSMLLPIVLPTVRQTSHLRRLTIGMSSLRFLELLLCCIPSIEKLSVGVKDPRSEGRDTRAQCQ